MTVFYHALPNPNMNLVLLSPPAQPLSSTTFSTQSLACLCVMLSTWRKTTQPWFLVMENPTHPIHKSKL